MMNKTEIIILVVVVLVAAFMLYPSFKPYPKPMPSPEHEMVNDMENHNDKSELFTAIQQMNENPVYPIDPDASTDGSLTPKGDSKNYESLIFDNVTGTIMSGSQFMENTGLVTPPWVAPAWNPDAYGPSSKGTQMKISDFEDDPRMLYNKCSLSCCSAQYPTPFQGDVDPFVFDKNGNKKFLASNYVCQNNTGGTGCLCMSEKQVDGMHNGFVDYYVDQKNLGY